MRDFLVSMLMLITKSLITVISPGIRDLWYLHILEKYYLISNKGLLHKDNQIEWGIKCNYHYKSKLKTTPWVLIYVLNIDNCYFEKISNEATHIFTGILGGIRNLLTWISRISILSSDTAILNKNAPYYKQSFSKSLAYMEEQNKLLWVSIQLRCIYKYSQNF